MYNFYSREELERIGFQNIGTDVSISRKASIFRPERISIGNHVRIDDFCLLSGNIVLGSYIHIAAYSAFFGGSGNVVMKDFSGLAYRCTIIAETDDYCGEYLTNPTVSGEYRGVMVGKVVIGKHVIIGAGSTVLPDVELGEGCSFGAMSLVNRNTEPWGVYVGVPCVRIRERNKELLKKESVFLQGGN